ncbi:MAG TPA: GNAT family N-acetyltransferase [Baekduia sp.]|nr:GNAT family N-acetyltransferase [Baekduia sp.]
MSNVRELGPGEEGLAAAALRELRPHLGDPAAAAAALRPDGYRLLAAFAAGEEQAAAVAGFRVLRMLAHGTFLYVDDLVTVRAHRGAGHATALLRALDAHAREAGCAALHLDSGVGPERQAAHRRYFGHGMRIASYHFTKPL